jgi:hypothetical protein
MEKQSVLLIGSYNGQDSFGDKCLLRCVAFRMKQVFGGGTRCISHVHGTTGEASEEFPDVTFRPGISTFYWPWHNRLRHLRLPRVVHQCISFLLFPFFCATNAALRRAAQDVIGDIEMSRLLYFYGGTQLSGQWFWFNFPPLVYTMFLCRVKQIPVFFGPQQYGNQTRIQRFFLRAAVAFFVKEIRVRNVNCLRLLELGPEALSYDEAFSCVERYPIIETREDPGTYLMVNVRGADFLNEHAEFSREYQRLLEILLLMQKKLSMPLVLFQMSGQTFCDDTRFFSFVKERYPSLQNITCLGLFENEKDLITRMSRAHGTISMSFHGCLFSMIAGTPAVPVSLGGYYSYKYADFNRYTGGQDVPVIQPGDTAVRAEEAAEKARLFFIQYDRKKAVDARRQAHNRIRRWYQTVKNESGTEAP